MMANPILLQRKYARVICLFAEKAGITKGTVITKIGGTSIDGTSSIQNELQYYEAGEEVEVTIEVPSEMGGYEEKVVTVKLDKKS